MKVIFTTILTFILFLGFTNAQEKFMYKQVLNAKQIHGNSQFQDLEFKSTLRTSTFNKQSSEALLEFDKNLLKKVIYSQSEYLETRIIGFNGEKIEVSLIRADIFSPDFVVTLDNLGTKVNFPVDQKSMVFYRGIVTDDPNSLVAISMANDKVQGFISSDNHDLALTTNAIGENVLLDMNGLDHQDLDCSTLDDGQEYAPEMLKTPSNFRGVGDDVEIFIEVESDVKDWLGGVSATVSYISNLFNESAAIYAGDGVNKVISELEINESLEYFTRRGKRIIKPSSASSYLSLFQSAKASSFNGDLAQLVAFNNVGGIAAGFSGLCNSNRANSMCISGFVSDYLFNLQIFAHELGHLFGSRHTHACVWNGNNTAIDGCAGGTEGSCPTPPPATNNTGTIMSYCYNNYGLDFNEGFHPQPSAVIQNNVAAASCLGSGTGGPTCFDGIQNGDETGVDCGGSCDPCVTCNDGIQNGDETGVDCGGSCPTTCPPAECSEPSNLLVSSMRKRRGNYSARLSWSGPSSASNYELRIRTLGSSTWSNFNTSSTSITVDGLSNGANYEWEVRSICGTSPSDFSSCTFTFVNRGSNVNCGAGSQAAVLSDHDEEILQVSPNPAYFNLEIKLENPNADNYSVAIFNAVGQRVLSTNISSNNNRLVLDVEDYETGLYFISVSSDSKRFVKKVIIK